MAKNKVELELEPEFFANLESQAKAHHQSIHNFIINVLKGKEITRVPNAETLEAIKEVDERKNLTVIDDVDAYMDAI